MSNRFTVVVGPARSGKTEALLATYRKALAAQRAGGQLDTTLWLAPNRRAVEQIRARLLTPELPACFSPGIQTFDQFAERVTAYAETDIRPIDDRMKRLLIERLLREALAADKLKHFAPIAATPGFLDLAAQFISELKRVEIWPEHFEAACREADGIGMPGKLSARERELIELYKNYQLLLTRHRLYDFEGRFWSARELLKQGQSRPYERLDLIVVDGFSDFTRTQLEILDELAGRSQQTVISLPDEAGVERDELFAKPRRTLAELHRRQPGLILERHDRHTSPNWPALDHIERQIFKSPRDQRVADDAAGIEFLAASGSVAEIEELARRIKRLLVVGDENSKPTRAVRPDDIVVVFRSLNDSAPLVREIFTRYGIPTALEAGRPLGQSPSLTALLALVKLAAEDWTFRDLLAVLCGNYFRPAWPEYAQPGVAEALERTIRHAQVPVGRAALLETVKVAAMREPQAVGADDPFAERRLRQNRARNDSLLSLPVLRKLAAALDDLPARASGAEWSAALERLAKETGLKQGMRDARSQTLVSQPLRDLDEDYAALELFHKALVAGDALAEMTAEVPPTIELAELPERLESIVHCEQLPGEKEEAGRVRVLGAITARSLGVPYLFVAGLTEKSFPAGESGSRLFNEFETQQLAKCGLPLASTAERRRDEMLLFYETITRAERRLWLSYPALNEKAEPLLPSPYLAELCKLCGQDLDEQTRISDLRPIPPDEAMLNVFDARIRGTVAAAGGDTDELAAAVQASGNAGENLLAGLAVVDERSRGEGFGPYEGMILGEASRRLLAQRFHADFPWSAGQLEQYGACPYQFFLDRVLRLSPPGEVGLEIDYGKRGNRAHEILAELHARINRRLQREGVPSELADQYAELVDEIIDEFLGEQGDQALAEAFRAVDEKLLRRWLHDYIAQHEKYEQSHGDCEDIPLPRHFEASFGIPNPPDDTISTTEPLRIRLEQEQVLITGRIDRIDVGMAAGRAVFTIIDYKTGSAAGYTKNAVLSGQALQLTLYAMAAETLLLDKHGAVPWQFGYWFVADTGFKKTLLLHETAEGMLRETDAWTALRDTIRERVVALVRGIRRGEFPMHSADEDCTSHCDFRTVCRVGQVRSLEKAWQPPSPARR